MGSIMKGFFADIIDRPQKIMEWFVNHQNKDQSFVQQYAWIWFFALVCWVFLTAYCYRIDFQVLYALEYISTGDTVTSWRSAAFNAAVIQFLLLLCGGGFFKVVIFRTFIEEIEMPTEANGRKYRKVKFHPSHSMQMVILGGLFTYAFIWTISLSQKTGALARVEAKDTIESVKQERKDNTTTLQEKYDKQVENYRADAKAQIESIQSSYQDRINSVSNKHTAIIKQYEARRAQGLISQAHMQKRTSGHKAAKEKNVAPLLADKATKIEAIQNDLVAKLATAEGLFSDQQRAVDYQYNESISKVNLQIEETATATQGRNVQYNFLNQALWVALLIFACSAKGQESPTKPTDAPSKKGTRKPVEDSKESVKGQPSTDSKETATSPKNNVHNLPQEEYVLRDGWPKHGQKPVQRKHDGYVVQGTSRKVIKILHNGLFQSKSTVKGWVQTYESRGCGGADTCMEYKRMLKAMEAIEGELNKEYLAQNVA